MYGCASCNRSDDAQPIGTRCCEQTVVDVTVLSLVYLPTFYIFKASVFSTSWDPISWFRTGSVAYTTNIRKDVYAALTSYPR